ncbi:hypothetical protein EGW08_015067 [Elysia chlorotica]|uniref:Uncharacterized protein n=1 Tax=Elysia chlorotica TaxID=188477 RepID=A0A433T6K2_ELYCH|nr:hypothetical protein EGW08_015067 [Elysia chlorotica]
MADWTQGQDKDESTHAKSRGSRSPSPVLIYPPPQQSTEHATVSSPFFQPPTLLREPLRSSAAKVEASSPSLLASLTNDSPTLGTSETFSQQAPALLREPLRSLSAKVETSTLSERLESLNINSETHPNLSTNNDFLQSASQPETSHAMPSQFAQYEPHPQPSTEEPQGFARADSPPPPPVPPLPSSYITISPTVSSTMSPAEQPSEQPVAPTQDETPPLPFYPLEKNLNKSQNSIGPVGSLLCREATPSPEIRRGQPRLRRPRQNSELGSSFSDVATLSPTSPKAMVVTDLDQAMAQMDEQKLKSRFRSMSSPTAENSSFIGEANGNATPIQPEDEETNIDDEPASVQRIANLKQKSIEVELSASNTSCQSATPTTSRQRRRRSEREKIVPAVTFDEALKMPSPPPADIALNKFQEFDGETLASWLCSEFSESHYLHSTLTRHDFRILVFQICTHLLSLGILRPTVEKKPPEVFKVSPDRDFHI